MGLSNVITFNLTATQLITRALNSIGVVSIESGGSPSTNSYNCCQDILNMFLKSLNTRNIHMWEEKEATLFLTSGLNKYTINNTLTNDAGDNTNIVTLTANGANNSFVLSNVNYMSVNDNFGVVLDSGTIMWTTISTINTTTLTVTTAASLSSPASSGAVCFVYTNSSAKPLNISSARYQTSGGSERVLKLVGKDEWMAQPLKANSSQTTFMYYNAGETDGTVYLYPTPNTSSDCINFSYSRTIYDITTGTDNLDIPQEWLLPVTMNLGRLLAPFYGKDLTRLMPDYLAQAQEYLLEATLWDTDAGSTYIVPQDAEDEE